MITGATLAIVASSVSLPLFAGDPLSVTVIVTVYLSLGVPVGLSSRYLCDPEHVPAPLDSPTVPLDGDDPSPQSIEQVCVSPDSTSVNVALTGTVSFSFPDWSAPAVTTGASLTGLTVIETVAVSQRLSPPVAAFPSWPGSQSEYVKLSGPK